MIRPLEPICKAGMAALLLAPLPAVAQQAAWAQDSREPVCVFDGLLASPDTSPSQIGLVRDACRQRFGWTEDQANRGLTVAMIMVQMLAAQREARDAGVDQAVIDAVRATFSATDVAGIGVPGDAVNDRTRATIGLIAARMRDRGLTGDLANKATRAVLFQMMAESIIAAFSREVTEAPAG